FGVFLQVCCREGGLCQRISLFQFLRGEFPQFWKLLYFFWPQDSHKSSPSFLIETLHCNSIIKLGQFASELRTCLLSLRLQPGAKMIVAKILGKAAADRPAARRGRDMDRPCH